MSTITKIGSALIIVLAFILIGWFITSNLDNVENPTVNEQQQLVTPTPEPKLPNTAGTGMSDVNDLSQEGLQKDLEAFSNQTKELDTEATDIDSGLKETI